MNDGLDSSWWQHRMHDEYFRAAQKQCEQSQELNTPEYPRVTQRMERDYNAMAELVRYSTDELTALPPETALPEVIAYVTRLRTLWTALQTYPPEQLRILLYWHLSARIKLPLRREDTGH